MLKDLRHAVRVLLHAKGWTAVVLLSLPGTARTVFFRSLVPAARRLVTGAAR